MQAPIETQCDGRHFHSGEGNRSKSHRVGVVQAHREDGKMPLNHFKTKAIDALMLLLGGAIAAPFILMLVAPFTNGL